MSSEFAYTAYVRVPLRALWEALTDPDFNRRFWFGYYQQSEWNKFASWKLQFSDGEVRCTGEILECDAPRRAVIRWLNVTSPELKAEGESICTYELEPAGDCVRLTLTHRSAKEKSAVICGAAASWPKVLASLKSLLETGKALDIHTPMKGPCNG